MNPYPVLYDRTRVTFGRIERRDEILALMTRIFARQFSPALIDWYFDAPRGPNRWYAAFDEHEPIALYGLLPTLVQLGDQILNGMLCNNVGIVTEYQGKGLFQTIGEYA